jgi:hypothetical protein
VFPPKIIGGMLYLVDVEKETSEADKIDGAFTGTTDELTGLVKGLTVTRKLTVPVSLR